MINKILVTVDFSDLSTEVVGQAADLALAFKAEVYVMHVIPPMPVYSGSEISPPVIMDYTTEEWRSEQHDLETMADFLKQKGIKADTILISGPITEVVLNKATELKTDLIIVGAHNHGFLYRAFIGSVSEDLLKRASCPILVIPGGK
jgi:nucleotide-binding universal stress UspA family protein